MEPGELRSRAGQCIDRFLDRVAGWTGVVLHTIFVLTVYTQSVYAQEGIEGAANSLCVDRVASLVSLGYYGFALYVGIKGFFMIEAPDDDSSRKEERSTRMKGLGLIGLAAISPVLPVVAAAAGILDVTSCIGPQYLGG